MKISALIPAYNAGAYIGQALESVLGQHRPPDEIIVVDDGSSDHTVEVVRRYPVRLIVQENAGVSRARNRCLHEATGDLVAWLDADDVWMPDHLSRLEPLLNGHVLAFGDSVRLFETGPERETYADRSRLREHFDISRDEPTILGGELYKTLLPGLFIHLGSTLMRRTDALATGLFDLGQVTSADRLFVIKVVLTGSSIFDPRVHNQVRIHPDSITAPRNHLKVCRGRLRVLELCPELIGSRLDDGDRKTLRELRDLEHARMRRIASERGWSEYLRVPGALTHPRDLARTLFHPFRRGRDAGSNPARSSGSEAATTDRSPQ